MIQGKVEAAGRTGIRPFVLAWAVACAILVMANLPAIANRSFPDPDDTLRLIQVRDWLAGQSWFDLTQYRMNAPAGAPMHWSRIVDLPIAAVIGLLTPLLGAAQAETAALVSVPLLTLGVVMALIALATRRLLDSDHAVLAAFLVPVPMAIMHQLKPMRIDHHGWQMALAAGILLAMLSADRRRSGIIAGALAAIWLAISLEGLPFAAALIALCALRWLIDDREAERLTAATTSLAATSLVLFALTKDAGGWGSNFCDAISPAHLAALGVGAVGMLLIAALRPAGRLAKAAMMSVLGAAVIAAMVTLAPQCTADPFGQLDPLVYSFWYLNVPEGLPLWRQDTVYALLTISFPIVGLAGSVLQWRRSIGTQRTHWAVAIFLLAAAMVTTLFVQRASGAANLLALPGGVALARLVILHARGAGSPAMRLAAMAAAIAIIAPGHVIAFAGALASGEARAAVSARPARCLAPREIDALNQLPPSDFATPLDIGPSVLVRTRHRIIASGHHRNNIAMRDQLNIFLSRPEESRRLMAARSIDLVAVCPGLPELQHYERRAPHGLWSRLDAGQGPEWLEPVKLPGMQSLKVWRVKR